jgi:hypothetical protein
MFSTLEVSVSYLQQRLVVITDAELAAIASAAHLKSQLSELEGLRERVRKASEIAAPETRVGKAATPALIWKAATINLPAAGF